MREDKAIPEALQRNAFGGGERKGMVPCFITQSWQCFMQKMMCVPEAHLEQKHDPILDMARLMEMEMRLLQH